MFTDEDKKFLSEVIKKAVHDELTVEMTWEKVRDEKTGQKLAKTELLKEKVFLPSFISQQIAWHEGAARGLQEDCNKSIADMKKTQVGVNAIAGLMIDMEKGLKSFLAASKIIQDRIEQREVKLLDGKSDTQ